MTHISQMNQLDKRQLIWDSITTPQKNATILTGLRRYLEDNLLAPAKEKVFLDGSKENHLLKALHAVVDSIVFEEEEEVAPEGAPA